MNKWHITLLLLSTPLSLTVLPCSGRPMTTQLQRRDAASDLSACLTNQGLQPVASDNSAWSTDITSYNQRVEPNPQLILYPSTPDQVASILTCSASSGFPISARSGGHSYASFGLGGVDGAVIIDLSGFKNITVDSTDGVTAQVGAGNRLGDLALALNDQGRALGHGVCPWVGIGGHASYGGFGLAGRMFGLTVDQVTGFDVVLSNGTVLLGFTNQDDPDLFWALAGAAPSFGVITSFYFKTSPAPPSAIVYSYSWSSGSINAFDAAELFYSYQQFGSNNAPAELGVIYVIGQGGSITLSGVYYGTMNDFESTVSPLTSLLPGGYTTSINQQNWIGSVSTLANGQNLKTQGQTQPRDTFFAKSLMIPESSLMTNDTINNFIEYMFENGGDLAWFVEVNLYGGANSKINSISPSTNSFGHRNMLLAMQIYASSPNYGLPYPDDGFTFVQGVYDTIVNTMSQESPNWSSSYGSYVNYVDPTLTLEESQQLYWGDQYERLSTLKGKYDPSNVLRNPQSIVATI